MTVTSGAGGPLDGVRVVEMGQLIAGPFCGQLLGDFGAEVIKVEPPGQGDPMRQWGQPGYPLFWEVLGRNKRSVSIDLREPAGQALARRLIATADILVENFRPGTLERWGLSPDVLRKDHPGLIIVRVSGYGQDGPYAGRAGFGGIGEAMGGWRAIVGDPDRPPSRMGVSIGDSLAATFACLGALAALRHRDRTGEGQTIDSSLFESVLQVMESLVPDYVVAGHQRARSGAILPGVAPSNVYPCQDGEYLIAGNQDTVFQRLCQAMGRPELAADPRYATHQARGERQAELDALIAEWTAGLTVDEVEAAMVEAGVPAGRIYRAPDMLADPHFAARKALTELTHPRWGRFVMQSPHPKLSQTPGSVRRVAPQAIGQDNAEVYQALGLPESEIEALAKTGVI
ncbi:CaiB/BaiF CoA transferase family protein [Phenylobacterium montanum]|uniref:CoA transferase n=1 Tax=Phenylobacterium montanum TaxID=2823693 RepID=A0A975G259_9CAUL|nr:CoA transferase [Caulobacter sp. S6]QUD89331.1 CoA transferase [Caulobacter sp. S6]